MRNAQYSTSLETWVRTRVRNTRRGGQGEAPEEGAWRVGQDRRAKHVPESGLPGMQIVGATQDDILTSSPLPQAAVVGLP